MTTDARFRDQDGTVHDTLLDRPVQVRSGGPGEAEGIIAEARRLSRLGRGGPVVLDLIRNDDGGVRLLLHASRGQTLDQAIATRTQGGPSPSQIADPVSSLVTMRQVSDILACAHAEGMVHGAVTATAIRLTEDGLVAVDGWIDRPLPSSPETAREATFDDIRAVGALLFLVLVGEAVPRVHGGGLAPLDEDQRARLPAGAETVIREALSASAAGGFATMAACREALGEVIAQRIVTTKVGRSHRNSIIIGLSILVLAAVAVLALAPGTAVATYVAWGAPVVDESFSGDSWKQRWTSLGSWHQEDGRLVSAGDQETALIYQQRLHPPVAIEYTGRFSSTVEAGDLSVWWCEGDVASLRPGEDPDNLPGWYVQAGAMGNSWCTIWKTPDRIRSQVNARVLAADHDYRFRVEIDVDRLRMWIDGELVLEHSELFPIDSGMLALYTYDPGKAFDNVRIWQKRVPDAVSPLAVGDYEYRAGRFEEAERCYRRVADSQAGGALGDRARYFQGLALHRMGDGLRAKEAWHRMNEGPLRRRAETLMIDDLVSQGDLINACQRLRQTWKQHPDIHDVLRQRWQVCGQRLNRTRPRPIAALDQWIALRAELFPDDRASRWLVADILNRSGRWEEVLADFPDEQRSVASALLALGRNREVAESDWAIRHERVGALIGMGDLDAALASSDLRENARAGLLCKTGRFDEALAIDAYPTLFYRGDIDRGLAENRFGPHANEALILLRRYQEAAGEGVAGSPHSGGSLRALTALGCFDEADAEGFNTSYFRLVNALAQGRLDLARDLRLHVQVNRDARGSNRWFEQSIGLALIDRALGDTAALDRALASAITTGEAWGGRLAAVAEAARDPGGEDHIRALAWKPELTAWLHLAQALRAELTEDRPAALQAWRALYELPPELRLLDGHAAYLEVEATAAWRIQALGAQP